MVLVEIGLVDTVRKVELQRLQPRVPRRAPGCFRHELPATGWVWGRGSSETIFSTIPGSPAYVAKAKYHKVHIPEHGMEWSFVNRNAVEGSFRFVA